MNIKKSKNNVSIFNLFMQMKDSGKVYLVAKGNKLFIADNKNLTPADVKVNPEDITWC